MAKMDRMIVKRAQQLEQWLEVSDVAHELGVSTTCVTANYIKGGEGDLRALKKNGRWRVHRDDLAAFRALERPHGTNRQYRE